MKIKLSDIIKATYGSVHADMNVNLKVLKKLRSDPHKDSRFISPAAVNYDPEKLPRDVLKFAGFTINLEFKIGSIRQGVDRNGNAWFNTMKMPYGEFAGSYSTDGDPLDVFLGDNPNCQNVFIIHMAVKDDWSKYDEDKAMLGFTSRVEALEAFVDNYGDERFILDITSYPIEKFRTVLKEHSQSGLPFTNDPDLSKYLMSIKNK